MKSVFVAIFAFIGCATYANSATVDVIESLDILENNKSILKENTAKQKEVFVERKKVQKNEVAFEYYYTMDWLYEETPFMYKLEVLV